MSWNRMYVSLAALVLALTMVGCGGDTWFETFNPDEDEPYGISLLPSILQARFPDAGYEKLPRNWTVDGLNPDPATLYVSVGSGLLYTQTEAQALATFIEAGGEAFLAAKEVSNSFLSNVLADSCLGYKSLLPNNRLDSVQRVESANGASFLWPVIRRTRGSSGSGNFIKAAWSNCLERSEHLLMIQRDSGYFETYHAGRAESQPIMSRFPYGKGHLTLLSYPLVLTNAYAVDSVGRIALEEVLKLLPSQVDHIAFDHARRTQEYAVVKDNMPKGEGFDDESNILKHVLARPPLATAWYLLLLGTIVFLVFGAKRRQRLIPLVQPRKNTTHEHLGNISRLYLSQPNNNLMATKQFALFEAYCNRRFGLRPLHSESDYDRFSNMAGVNPQHLETLKRYQTSVTRNQAISNTGFVTIVRILQTIYKGIGRRFD